jgi:hypothetical protein
MSQASSEEEARVRNKLTNFGWENEFKLPNGWTLAGHSEGREASGFVLVEPRIFLDAGIYCRKWSPHAVLVRKDYTRLHLPSLFPPPLTTQPRHQLP